MYLLPVIMECESTQWWIILLILTIIPSPSKQDPTIRLADGDERQGRVEVYLNGEWGTICDDRWDILDGDVVCRQLGFLYAEEVMDGAFYGEGLGHVLMDEVTCDGTERTLFECPYSRHHNCIHSEDAGLVCSDAFDVRLVNGDEVHGLVEVYMDRQWGPVCADRWNIIDADIVCRQLGYLHAENTTSETSSTNGTLIGRVKCKGKENILSECSYVVHPNCTEGEISWVTCSAGIRNLCNHEDDCVCALSNGGKQGVRLRGGEGKHEGRVEIHANGLWGTVCDEGWNIKDANVVCRQLGFSEAVSASREAYWEEGDSPILMSNVHCQGNEHSLLACASTKRHSCTHEQDAGVTCKRDEERFEITYCPSNMSVPVPPGVIKAAVEWDDPIVTGGLIDTTSSHESGNLFDLGLTEVTYNFTSKSGNFTSCSFYVALCPADCNNARQYCPASITKEVEAGTNTSRIYWSELMFDKCHYNVSKTHSSGEEFSLGNTEVTFTCTDSKFVYNLCKFDVRVVREIETISSSVSPLVKNFFEENIWVIVTTTLGFGMFVLISVLLIQTCRKRRSSSSNSVEISLNGTNIQQPANKADGKWKDEDRSTYRTSLKDSDTNAVYEEPSAVFDEIQNSKPVDLENERLYSKHLDRFDEDFGSYVTMK